MRVNVLLFASLREAVGKRTVALELSDDATVAGLLTAISEAYPSIASLLPSVKVAVNRELARPERPLSDGDEAALLPPFGGG